jgi:hypothetical protein
MVGEQLPTSRSQPNGGLGGPLLDLPDTEHIGDYGGIRSLIGLVHQLHAQPLQKDGLNLFGFLKLPHLDLESRPA